MRRIWLIPVLACIFVVVFIVLATVFTKLEYNTYFPIIWISLAGVAICCYIACVSLICLVDFRSRDKDRQTQATQTGPAQAEQITHGTQTDSNPAARAVRSGSESHV